MTPRAGVEADEAQAPAQDAAGVGDSEIDVTVDDPRWQVALGSDPAGFVCETLAFVAAREGCGPFELCVLLSDDAVVHGLNAQFRGKDAPTNVLSFPAAVTPVVNGALQFLGDIAIAYDTVAREAAAQGKPFAHHTRHLLVHGMLHLCGYDHIYEHDAGDMEAREIAILEHFGVSNPY